MDICNRVKLFEGCDISDLEKQINYWFKQNEVLLVDVKFNCMTSGTYGYRYTAMIIYQ